MRLQTLILLCAVVSSSLPLFGQVDRATVTGVLRDPSGAVVTDATITIAYPATNLSRSVVSNAQGVYLLGNLPVGHAVIEAGKAGFRPIHVDTDLKVGETKTLDFEMDVAGIDSRVEVLAEADLVRNSAAVGATFDDQQISQLPINGRNWSSLMTLTPGAIDTGAGNGASVRFFASGADDNNYRIDGVDATSVRNQTESKSRLMISEDAIAEFRVNSQMYTAETGGATAGQVEVATKSGTNQVHGTVFEYFRNSALDSRSPFDGAKLPLFHMN